MRVVKNHVHESVIAESYRNMYEDRHVRTFAFLICYDYLKDNKKIFEIAERYIDDYYDELNDFLRRSASIYYYKYKQLFSQIDLKYDVLNLLHDILLTLKCNIATYIYDDYYNIKKSISATKSYVRGKKIRDKLLKDFIDLHYDFAMSGRVVIIDFTNDVLEELIKIVNKTKSAYFV